MFLPSGEIAMIWRPVVVKLCPSGIMMAKRVSPAMSSAWLFQTTANVTPIEITTAMVMAATSRHPKCCLSATGACSATSGEAARMDSISTRTSPMAYQRRLGFFSRQRDSSFRSAGLIFGGKSVGVRFKLQH